MKKILFLFIAILLFSCGRKSSDSDSRIVTVSIAPFSYFVRQIGGNDFSINIMVPPGSNPHIYEPVPGQIKRLSKSVAFISNGYLGYEMTWLDRFYEVNKNMEKISLGENIDPVASTDRHHNEHAEGTDPHYWVSPRCALQLATRVRDLLCRLNPGGSEKYRANCDSLQTLIKATDARAKKYFSKDSGKSFMIYHPNLAYLARDYGLNEIAVEYEGKEPPPSRLRELIDLAASKNIKIIFVQREYDSKNAREIAREIGGKVVVIDPLSEDWLKSTNEIIDGLHDALEGTK